MSKLRFPTLQITNTYEMYLGNSFPDINRNYLFLMKEAGSYNLSEKQGYSGVRLILRNDSDGNVLIQLNSLITVTVAINKLIEVIWDEAGWYKLSVDIEDPLFLGETETTAYRGDRGKAAYDHISLTTAHEATSSNTASRIVLRDSSGNFSAGIITANLTGVASEAIKLQTARTINGIPFDGTADITIDAGSSLLLGETETTAYRGDRGKAAYDHISLTSVHEATSANTASRIVLRDENGNFSAGTITASLFVGQLGNRSTWNSSTAAVNSVIGQLSWRNYGNNHTIIDISNGATPDGTSHNNTNAENGWVATYPTLVGWNGTATYGLRVDSARVADTAPWSGVSGKPNLWSGSPTNGYWGLVNPAGSDSDWIRTSVNGIIPYASGGSSYIGTSSWPFNYIYGTNFYGTIHGTLDSGWCVPAILIVPTNSSATNGCVWLS